MPLPVQRYLDITHVGPVGRDQPPWAMDKLLGVLARVWGPATVRFVVSAGGGTQARAGWEVLGSDVEDVEAVAEDLRTACGAVAPWLGLTAPVDVRPWPAPGPAVDVLLPGPPAPSVLVAGRALAWAAAARSPDRWTMLVELVALPGPEVRTVPSDESADTGSGWAGRSVLCRVSLHGTGSQRRVMTALLAEDSDGPVSLVGSPARSARHGVVELPARTVAHLLASPARMDGAFPSHPSERSDGLLDLVLSAPTPHLLVIGASGQGKSTFMRGLAVAGMRRGALPVVVDVEDGLTVKLLARACREAGLDPLVIDFGASVPSRLDLTTPPAGIGARRWADELWTMLRQVLWSGMPEAYFGPVGERLMRFLILLVVLDPAGPRPLTDIPALIDPEDDDLREQVLDRIDDADLERTMRTEVLPMLRARDPGNASVFLLSKLEPLTGPEAVRAATRPGAGTADIEGAVAAGRPILLHAPTAVLGDAGSRVLVMVALHRFWLAAQRRSAGAPYDVYLDEFHKYAGATVEDVLARGRKRGVRLRLAHQHLGQVTRPVLDAVLGNTGSLCCFRTGPADAALVEGRFPTITARQLQALPGHHLAVTVDDREGVYRCPPPSDEQQREEQASGFEIGPPE